MEKLTEEELRGVMKRGEEYFERLKEELKDVQVYEALPLELAGRTYAIFQSSIEANPVLRIFADELRSISALCAYAGMKYAEEQKE